MDHLSAAADNAVGPPPLFTQRDCVVVDILVIVGIHLHVHKCMLVGYKHQKFNDMIGPHGSSCTVKTG